MPMLERGGDVSDPFGVQELRSCSDRIIDGRDRRQRPIVHVDKPGEVLRAIAISRNDKGDGLADKADAIQCKKFRQPIADARMPIAHDPGLVVEGQIPSGQNGNGAGGHRAGRIDRNHLGMRQGAAHEGAMSHPVKLNVVNEAGAPAQKASVFLAQHQCIGEESGSRCRPDSSKFSGASHRSNLARRCGHSSSTIAYHAVSRLRPFWIMCRRNTPSKENPSRNAARREGSFSALHFHS